MFNKELSLLVPSITQSKSQAFEQCKSQLLEHS